MGKVSQLVNVRVVKNEKTADKRKLSVEIEAPLRLLLLPDTLSHAGALKSLEANVRRASRDAVTKYILAGRDFIKGAAAGKCAQRKSVSTRTGQDKRDDAKLN